MNNPLRRAVELAKQNVLAGGEPFGAVVVSAGGEWFEGVNAPEAMSDPTAHAEINAIRAAATELGPVLNGATLYSSAEPCPMCLGAALWAGVDRLVYAATQQEAAGFGFDNGPLYEQVVGGVETVTDFPVEQARLAERLSPFEATSSS